MSFGFAIRDFVITGQLAWTLYRDCYAVARGAPQEFQLLLGEISALSSSLKILQEEVDNPDSILRRSGEDRVRMVNEMVSRVNLTLKELQKVATKYAILGDSSKGKRLWQKLKWSAEFSSIDALRNKLIYHNGVMNLLLTSVGNSSLNRIESSARALETDVREIKGYIKGNQSSTPPLVSVVDDKIFKISLSARLMKNAEVYQPWSAIGVEQWIQAGRWWLLKSQMELYATPTSNSPVAIPAYTNLIKASWILVDIVACHPQLTFLNSSTSYEVKLLSAALKREFQRIDTLGLVVPDLCDLEDQSLQIWEIQPRGPLLRPGNGSGNLCRARLSDSFWTVGGEQIYFRRFALHRQCALVEPLPCMVLFLVHETTNMARVVGQDQNENALLDITLQPQVNAVAEGNSVMIDTQNVTFTTTEDAELFCSIFEAAKLYFLYRRNDHVDLDDFEAFILLVAVKNGNQDVIMRLLEKPPSESDSSESSSLCSAFIVARTLASQHIRRVNNGLCENSRCGTGQLPLLFWAASNGYDMVVRLLIEKAIGWEPEARYNDQTPMLCAANYGHEAVVKVLIENGAELESRDSGHQTPLSWAASNGHEAVVKLLIGKGAELESKDLGLCTPLSWAAWNGHETVVKVLIEKGADLKSKDIEGLTPLSWAACNGHETVVKVLIEKGADLDSKDIRGLTPLLWAAHNGHEIVVKTLIEEGAELGSRTSFGGSTSLLWSAANGHEAVVKLLIEKGAKLESGDIYGLTPLSWAAINGREAVVRLLIKKGAKLEPEGSKSRTPLSWAASNCREAVVGLLIEGGADLEFADSSGRTPLLWAASSGHDIIVQLLIEKGAELEFKDRNGLTPLLWAASKGHDTVVKLLIEKGAELEAKDSNGRTPLSWAVSSISETAVRLLIEKGAQIESRDCNGWTPLMWAVWNGYRETIKLLIEKGAELEPVDRFSKTQLSWFTGSGRDAVAEFLQRKV